MSTLGTNPAKLVYNVAPRSCSIPSGIAKERAQGQVIHVGRTDAHQDSCICPPNTELKNQKSKFIIIFCFLDYIIQKYIHNQKEEKNHT